MIILPPALVLLLTFSSSSITKASKFPSYPLLFYPTPSSHTLIFYLMPSSIAPFLHTSLLLFLPLLFYALAIIFPSSSIIRSSSSSVDISSSAYDWNRDELPKCKKLLIRKEWRTWTRREKMKWVGAVKVRCVRYPILFLIFFFFSLLCTTRELFFPRGVYSIWYRRLSDWKNGWLNVLFLSSAWQISNISDYR